MTKVLLSKLGKGLAVTGVGAGLFIAGASWTGQGDLNEVWVMVDNLAKRFERTDIARRGLENDLSALTEQYNSALQNIDSSNAEITRLGAEIKGIEANLLKSQKETEAEKMGRETADAEIARLESELALANASAQDLREKVTERIEGLPDGVKGLEIAETRLKQFMFELLFESEESEGFPKLSIKSINCDPVKSEIKIVLSRDLKYEHVNSLDSLLRKKKGLIVDELNAIGGLTGDEVSGHPITDIASVFVGMNVSTSPGNSHIILRYK